MYDKINILILIIIEFYSLKGTPLIFMKLDKFDWAIISNLVIEADWIDFRATWLRGLEADSMAELKVPPSRS